ncbi:ribonuclease H-like protein, partial [Rhodofomes roseus]
PHDDHHTNGEIVAALKAVLDTPKDAPLHILCSPQLIKALTTDLPRWEDKGWIEVANATYTRALVNQLRQRCAPTTLKEPSTNEEHNLRTLALQKSAEQHTNSTPTEVPPAIEQAFNLSGAKLSALSQATAYRGIRATSTVATRASSCKNEQRTLNRLADLGLKSALRDTVWRSIRNKEIHRKIVDFLWKDIHNVHHVGTYWTNIPGLEERAICETCGTTEDMEHILTRCRAPGQKRIWRLTKALWTRKGQPWRAPTETDILTASVGLYPRQDNSKTKNYLARLWAILIPEAAFLIWKLRCERVIGHADEADWKHTDQEISRHWLATVNRRLQIDLTATSKRFGHLAKDNRLVWATWTGTIGDEQGLYEDWTRVPRVLVGIDPGICATTDPG